MVVALVRSRSLTIPFRLKGTSGFVALSRPGDAAMPERSQKERVAGLFSLRLGPCSFIRRVAS